MSAFDQEAAAALGLNLAEVKTGKPSDVWEHELRVTALSEAVKANPNATSAQIARDAERFVKFLKGETDEA